MFKSKMAVLAGLLAISSTASADLTTGLVAHWSFNDCKATDSSGNGHVGVIYGAPKCVTGINGKALQFNGTGDFIEVPDTSELRLSGAGYTLSGWVLLKSYNESFSSALISKRGNNFLDGYIWGVSGKADSSLPLGSQVINHSGGGDPYHIASTKGTKLNNWQHFVAVYDAGTQTGKIYINNSLAGSSTSFPVPNANTAIALRIARDSDDINPNPYFLNGLLDDFRIYNRALDKGEITELYKIGRPVSGTVNGLQQISVTCKNLTTGQTINIPAQASPSWDCKKAGLKVNLNQSVNISIDGNTYQ